MKSIFRYPGGKSKKHIQEKILSFKPKNIKEYREPFVGGGGIFFGIEDTSISRWINDIDQNLINVYLALQNNLNEFIDYCKIVTPSKEWFNFFAESKTCDQALRYFFLNRTGWIGRVQFKYRKRLYYSLPEGWKIVYSGLMEEAGALLKNVKITSDSYERMLLEPSQGNCWIYCDPPYYSNTLMSEQQRMYAHNFTIGDHLKFYEIARKSPHKLCISYDNHPEIVKLYSSDGHFNIYSESWSYVGTSVSKKKSGAELIIKNY
jgi:DNA adenine methylase